MSTPTCVSGGCTLLNSFFKIFSSKFSLSLKRLIVSFAVIVSAACGNQFQAETVPLAQSNDYSIVNGVPVAADDKIAASIVALTFEVQGQQRSFCTATLLSDRFAVTAAHCAEVFEGKNIQLLFGLSEEQHSALRKVVAYKIHENYNNITAEDTLSPAPETLTEAADLSDETSGKKNIFSLDQQSGSHQRFSSLVKTEMKVPQMEGGPKLPRSASSTEMLLNFLPKIREVYGQNWNDLALIKFEGGLPVGYEPVSIHKESGQVTDLTPVILAGFGNTSGGFFGGDGGLLRKTTVKIAKLSFSETEILTDENGTGSCNGDSGGPVFIKNLAGQLELIGVTSRGDERCQIFGIYSFLPAFSEWIKTGLAELADQETL